MRYGDATFFLSLAEATQMMQLRLATVRLSLALWFICMAPAAWGDYDPTSLVDLAGASDVIAAGKIVEVGKNTFMLQLDEVFAGKVAPGDRLEIRKFDDWTCASRWGDYQVKERLFVFLTVAEVDGEKEFQIRGAGDEGELPIVDREVYVTPYRKEQLGHSVEYGTAKGGRQRFVKIPYDSFRDSIKGFRKCFEIEASHELLGNGELPARFSSIKQLCKDGEVAAFSGASDLNHQLIDELQGQYRWTVKRFGRQSASALEAVRREVDCFAQLGI